MAFHFAPGENTNGGIQYSFEITNFIKVYLKKLDDMDLRRIKVLLIESDKEEQILFHRFVEEHNLPYSCNTSLSVSEANAIFENDNYDIVITNTLFDESKKVDIFDKTMNIPIIVIVEPGDEETAIKSLKSGAYDYLIKDKEHNYFALLPITVNNAISRKKAELQLKMLLQGVKITRDSIYITDTETNIIFANESFCRTYGYNESEILGQSSIILSQNKMLHENFTDIDSKTAYGYYSNIRKDGSTFPAHLTRSFIHNEKNTIIGVIHVVYDITEQKKNDLERFYKEKLQSGIETVSSLCHELNQPMQTVIGYSDLIMMEVDENNQCYQMVKEIKKGVYRLSNTIEKLYNVTQNAMIN